MHISPQPVCNPGGNELCHMQFLTVRSIMYKIVYVLNQSTNQK